MPWYRLDFESFDRCLPTVKIWVLIVKPDYVWRHSWSDHTLLHPAETQKRLRLLANDEAKRTHLNPICLLQLLNRHRLRIKPKKAPILATWTVQLPINIISQCYDSFHRREWCIVHAKAIHLAHCKANVTLDLFTEPYALHTCNLLHEVFRLLSIEILLLVIIEVLT